MLLNLLEKSEKEYTPKTQVKDKMPSKNIIEDKGVNLLIIRDTFTDKSTIGKLFVNGEMFCDTLELLGVIIKEAYHVYQMANTK